MGDLLGDLAYRFIGTLCLEQMRKCVRQKLETFILLPDRPLNFFAPCDVLDRSHEPNSSLFSVHHATIGAPGSPDPSFNAVAKSDRPIFGFKRRFARTVNGRPEK